MGDLWALLVRPGGVCIDVGANIGVHTVRLAKLAGPEGSVHAIEAWPEVAARLAGNVELNGLVNVTIHTFAASSQLGEKLVLHLPARTNHRGRASGLRHEYLTDSITVDTTTVDSLNLSSLDLIKIDVEGAEGPVIAGAAATIERCQPAIVAELNTTMTDSTSGGYFDRFAQYGYRVWRIDARRHPVSGVAHLRLGDAANLSGNENLLAIPKSHHAFESIASLET